MECRLLSCRVVVGDDYEFCCQEHYEEALCRLPGCTEYRKPTPSGETLHPFCCHDHRQAAGGDRPGPGQRYNKGSTLSPRASVECRFAECKEVVADGYEFCSLDHYTKALCRLPGCTEYRAFTDNGNFLHQFCCREHKIAAEEKRPFGGRKCLLLWCSNPVQERRHKFCSMDHQKEALCKYQGCRELRPPTPDGKQLYFYCKDHYQYGYGPQNWKHYQPPKEEKARADCTNWREFDGDYSQGKSGFEEHSNKELNSNTGDKVPETEQIKHKSSQDSKKGRLKQKVPGPVRFYDRNGPYYEFTNFYTGKPIIIDGLEWKTTEHYFQAQKFAGTPYVELIRALSRPREAFDFSRKPAVSEWRRKDWHQVKQSVMYKALLAKFSQSQHLREMLASTGDRELVERSPYDQYWGDGGDGSGENHLGKLLMKVRSHICIGDTPLTEVQSEFSSQSFTENDFHSEHSSLSTEHGQDLYLSPQQSSPSRTPQNPASQLPSSNQDKSSPLPQQSSWPCR